MSPLSTTGVHDLGNVKVSRGGITIAEGKVAEGDAFLEEGSGSTWRTEFGTLPA